MLSSGRSNEAVSDGAYVITREDGSQQCLHLTYRLIQWENNAKAIAVSFQNITRLLHQQFTEGKTEVLGLVSACTSELLRPGLLRTAAELKLPRKGNPDLQLLGAFYALYCLEDLQKVLSNADFRPVIKSVHIAKEMRKIEGIFQPLFARYKLTYEVQITGLPELIKLDKIRFRQVLSLLFHSLSASSLLSIKLSPRSGLLSNEILVALECARSGDKPNSPLLVLADKLLRKLGTEGLRSDSNHYYFSFFAGFAAAETPLSLPQ